MFYTETLIIPNLLHFEEIQKESIDFYLQQIKKNPRYYKIVKRKEHPLSTENASSSRLKKFYSFEPYLVIIY